MRVARRLDNAFQGARLRIGADAQPRRTHVRICDRHGVRNLADAPCRKGVASKIQTLCLMYKLRQHSNQAVDVLDAAALEVQRGARVQLVEHMHQYCPALGRQHPVSEAEEAEVWAEVATGKSALDVGTHALPGVVAKILALAVVSRYARTRHGPMQDLGSEASD